MVDLGDPAWRGLVCVETGNIADNEVRLAADGEHQMSTAISVDPRQQKRGVSKTPRFTCAVGSS
jgi:hypothetical protein